MAIINNCYQNCTIEGGSNWNQILNALPKNQRKAFKCSMIAQPMRQASGTPMFRPLNIFSDTVSPIIGHPWSASGTTPNTEFDAYFQDGANPNNYYSVSVVNGAITLTFVPGNLGITEPVLLTDTVTSTTWQIVVENATINLAVGSGIAIDSYEFLDIETGAAYFLTVQNGAVTLST